MDSKKCTKYFLHSIVALSCAIGFIYQVVDISDRHFAYQTRTILKLDTLKEIELPAVSSCFQKNQMLDYSKVYSMYPNRSAIKHSKDWVDWDAYYRATSDWTVKTWFNFTPKSSEVLNSCGMRLPNDFGWSSKDCNSLAKVSKYFDREYVCYRFEPEANQAVGVIQSTMTPGYNGILYRVQFKQQFVSNYEYISIAVHGNDSSYFYDTVYGSTTKTNWRDKYHKFDAYHQEVEQIRMKVPYDTKCVDIPDNIRTGAEYQLHYMNQQSIRRLNKVIPFLPIYDDTLNQTLFNDLDMRNKSYSEFFYQILNSSKQLIECKTKYFITRTNNAGYHTFTIYIHWPQDKKISVIYAPLSETIDYVIYVGSCIGAWFGLSAISIVDIVPSVIKRLKSNIEDSDDYLAQKRMKDTIKYLMLRIRIIENNMRTLKQRNIL